MWLKNLIRQKLQKGMATLKLGSQYFARDASQPEIIIISMGFGRIAIGLTH